MPIQKETKLNTGAVMPHIGLGTVFARVILVRMRRLIFFSINLTRDVEVEPRGRRARSRARTQKWLQTHRHGHRL